MPADLETILRIRSTVLALGQKDAGEWWSCSFLTPHGERFLVSPFPRSAFWAALHASSIAAARHHDDRIGTGGTVHLFRLGPETFPKRYKFARKAGKQGAALMIGNAIPPEFVRRQAIAIRQAIEFADAEGLLV